MTLSTWAMAGLVFSISLAGAPFEKGSNAPPVASNAVDEAVLPALAAKGIPPAPLCSDAVFIRRVYLDVIGTLPKPEELRAYFKDKSSTKRAALIDALLERPEFADYWAMRWCDVLRVKAEFPINLWPNAVQAYHRWIWDAIRENRPYDEIARSLLTSSGSNFRVPPVNFYRAVQGRDPAVFAEAVALTFMGERFTQWPEARRKGMTAFFSRLAFKKTGEWKEEIVLFDPEPKPPVEAIFPDGVTVRIESGQDPREVFANWLLDPANPSFSRNIANRVWAWLMGRGVIQEPDDIRDDNPPSNPALLAVLTGNLVQNKFDPRALYRLILNSRTYQQSCIPPSQDPDAERLFAYYPARPLEAEVLADALRALGGKGETYMSATPEPYTYIPASTRAIALADGSISSPFLDMFGRPARDTGFVSERPAQPSDAQRLFMLNSSAIQNLISKSERLQKLGQVKAGDRGNAIKALYLAILSRMPTEEELAAVQAYAANGDITFYDVKQDLAWALINSKEFLYRH